MADELGTTEFWTARVAARLISDELVELKSVIAPVEEPDFADETSFTPEPVTETPKTMTEDPADVDPTQSWWKEPEAGPEPESELETELDTEEVPAGRSLTERISAAADEAEEDSGSEERLESSANADQMVAAAAAVSEGFKQMLTLDTAEPTEVEEDTEAFLEKVFSELEAPEQSDDDGYGLLRRQRMGTIRDSSNDA